MKCKKCGTSVEVQDQDHHGFEKAEDSRNTYHDGDRCAGVLVAQLTAERARCDRAESAFAAERARSAALQAQNERIREALEDIAVKAEASHRISTATYDVVSAIRAA